MKTILFVAQLETQLISQIRLARLLRSAGKYEPVFYFDHPHAYRLDKMRHACQEEGFRFINPIHKRRNGSSHKLLGLLLGQFIPALIESLQSFRVQINEAKLLIQMVRPNLIVVGEDGLGGNNAISKIGHRHKIKTLIVPYEYSNIRQHLEDVIPNPNYEYNFGMRRMLNRLIARLYPHWVYNDHGMKLLRAVPSRVLPLEFFGIAPHNPWTVHGGQADVLAVESPRMMRHYRNEGLPEEKLRLTGTLFDDSLAACARDRQHRLAKLAVQYGFNPKKRLLLCGLPTDFTYRHLSNFNNYQRLIDFWIQHIAGVKNMNVLFHPHPSITPEQITYIASKPIVLAKENIAELIPLCDLFITSISSTIRWAIALGIPVINYDVYKFRLHDFDDAAGVLTVEEPADFLHELQKMTEDAAWLEEIARQQRSLSSRWGIFDGKSNERILDFIDRLLDSEKLPQKKNIGANEK